MMKKLTLLLIILITYSTGFTQNQIVEESKTYAVYLDNAKKALQNNSYKLALENYKKARPLTNDTKEINEIDDQILLINSFSLKAAAEATRAQALLKKENDDKQKKKQIEAEIERLKRITDNLHYNLIRNDLFTKKKKKLFKSYKLVYQHLDEIQYGIEMHTYLKDIHTLQLNINYLKREVTDKLSKQVKSVKGIKETWTVFKENMPTQFSK
jgi:hypothetical protein